MGDPGQEGGVPAAADEDLTALVASLEDGWARCMGLRFVRVTRDEVVAEVDVGPTHRQPYGIVHGGVHAGLIETVASVGAGVNAITEGHNVVGLENHTSFLRAVREGTLRATARPLVRGRRSHVWDVQVTEGGRLVATGRVRMLILDAEAPLAGAAVDLGPEGERG